MAAHLAPSRGARGADHRIRVEFDGTAAYEALKAANCLPNEPGRIEVAGLVVELGQHIRIW
ncbi:MAG: hypothetical protein ACRELT_15985 [Longimicrobiales bacterium]